jgi:serine/threonine-protein kinase
MRDQRWQRIEELYHAALDRQPSERAAFLQAECAGDDTLRHDVESLLAEGNAEQFLATPALELAGREMAASRDMLIGRDIGPYQIESLLGAGGMGEVYRARDTKLHRDVAIKVLPSAVAHDRDRLTRFAREARLLAALNHPNIAAIHGVEEADGISALVLEFVDGETLSERIARGPLKTAEAIAIARQIGDGLESAHEHSIVHRDLKPSNIKLRPDGKVKILDFGLAKALAPADASGAPNRTSSLTQVGVITGTPAYMSPEQAHGQAVDERTDIWAFGCVLYEMLTGRQAFAGQSTTETLAAVIAEDPAWEKLPRDLTPGIRVFLKRCLSKDPRQRVSHIRDMRLALEGAFETDIAAPAGARRLTWKRALATAGAALVLILLTGFVTWTLIRPAAPGPLVSQFSFDVPPFRAANIAHQVAVSPDGTRVVYAGEGALWLRPLDTLQASMVPGTERSNAHTPFFSPDGNWIGFYDQSAGELKRAAVSGGAPIVVAAIQRPFGATWPRDDLILYGRGPDGIWQVSPANGTPERIVTLADGEEAHSPQVLPNGSILFTRKRRGVSSWNDAQIVVRARGSDTTAVVIQRGRDARYLPTGHLVFALWDSRVRPFSQISEQDELLAARFDVEVPRVVGDHVSVVRGVRGAFSPYTDASQFAQAGNGTLVYIPALVADSTPRMLVWVTRGGREEPLNLALRATNGWVRVSPDETRIAHAGGGEIFVSDTSRPSWIPIVSDTGNWNPVWSRDSRHVVFASPGRLMRTQADGTGEVELLEFKGNQLLVPGAWTRDGRRVVFTYGIGTDPHLGVLDLGRVGKTDKPWTPIDRPYDMSSPALSPRDEWIAYQSQYSGEYHVYIDRFPAVGDPKLVSGEGGGSQPVWSADGREVFYRRVDGAMMAVRVDTTPKLRIGEPVLLFENRGYGPGSTRGGASARGWDVAPDGRFLMIKRSSPPTTSDSIVVVQHWFEELKRKLN